MARIIIEAKKERARWKWHPYIRYPSDETLKRWLKQVPNCKYLTIGLTMGSERFYLGCSKNQQGISPPHCDGCGKKLKLEEFTEGVFDEDD